MVLNRETSDLCFKRITMVEKELKREEWKQETSEEAVHLARGDGSLG